VPTTNSSRARERPPEVGVALGETRHAGVWELVDRAGEWEEYIRPDAGCT
jgi:hypothetical protein